MWWQHLTQRDSQMRRRPMLLDQAPAPAYQTVFSLLPKTYFPCHPCFHDFYSCSQLPRCTLAPPPPFLAISPESTCPNQNDRYRATHTCRVRQEGSNDPIVYHELVDETPQIETPAKIKRPISAEKLEQSKQATPKGAEKKKK